MRKVWIPIVPALIAGLFSSAALAQQEEEALPPFYDVAAVEDTKPWFQWIAGALIIATCFAVAIKDPHRTHLD
ncbi:MAG: hypothetical protein SF069_18635 [Phycisphaerae bacterium]|nr:hypothetical protein [Phycisphaerae bacterium]